MGLGSSVSAELQGVQGVRRCREFSELRKFTGLGPRELKEFRECGYRESRSSAFRIR